MRDDPWLKDRLENIWSLLFPDVERLNEVKIRFKGKWKNKFGHIQMKKDKSSEIVINGLFKDPRVPENIIDATIAHELIHYMHGFQSPHKQRYKHPHAGGVVTRELKKRGFAHWLARERDFVRKEWLPIYLELTGKKKKTIFSRVFG
tara:strand:- start:6765 stop:7205 length:441 start_codon:yes stop_codon:yes gene_type:complete